MKTKSLLIFLTFSCAFWQNISASKFSSFEEALASSEQFIQQVNGSHHFPGLLIGVSIKGKTVFQKAYGIADLENGLPSRIDNHYRIASVSKTFTAALIGQLVDRGLIGSFDDPLSKYLPETVFKTPKWENKTVNITMKMLLSHRSGVPATTNEDLFVNVLRAKNITDMLHIFKGRPLARKPNTDFEYSNTGYQLLGGVIEAVTKRPFTAVMAEFLYKNGLHFTSIANTSTLLNSVPRYYSGFDPQVTLNAVDLNSTANYPTSPFDEIAFLNCFYANGGLVSTISDLLHYGQLILDAAKGQPEAILTQKTIHTMWTPQKAVVTFPVYVPADCGLGWFVSKPDFTKLKHTPAYYHSGGLLGMASMVALYPQEKMVAAIFINKGAILETDQMLFKTVDNIYDFVKPK